MTWLAGIAASSLLLLGGLWLMREYVIVGCVGGEDPACHRDHAMPVETAR